MCLGNIVGWFLHFDLCNLVEFSCLFLVEMGLLVRIL